MTTSNGEGCGHVLPGLGIHVNNFLGEDDINPAGFHQLPPGMSMSTMMSPTVVLAGDRACFALGSGGSNRIRSAILQALLNLLAYRRPLDEAVNAARLHVEGRKLWFESPAWQPESPTRCTPRGRRRPASTRKACSSAASIASPTAMADCAAPATADVAGWSWSPSSSRLPLWASGTTLRAQRTLISVHMRESSDGSWGRNRAAFRVAAGPPMAEKCRGCGRSREECAALPRRSDCRRRSGSRHRPRWRHRA
jgi:hypothetical protein